MTLIDGWPLFGGHFVKNNQCFFFKKSMRIHRWTLFGGLFVQNRQCSIKNNDPY